MLGGWSVRAVPMAAVDPYFDALHLGGLLAVLAGSALLYWMAASLLSLVILTSLTSPQTTSLWFRRWFMASGEAWPQKTHLVVAGLQDGRLIVAIVAGVNDVYQGRSAESVVREHEAMYGEARAASIPIVAGTIVPYNTATVEQNVRMRAVIAWIREYAARHADMAFCDTRAAVAAPGSPDRLLSSPDDLHPSADGYRRMALALAPAIEELSERRGWRGGGRR